MVDIDWDIAQRLALIQLLVVVLFGCLFGLAARFRFPESPSCEYFRPGEYSSSYEEDPKVIFKTIPNWFRFVRVEYEDNEMVKESFFSYFGDVTSLHYLEENRLRIESNFYANNLIFSFAALGLGLIILSRLFTSSIVTVFAGDQNSVALVLFQLGLAFFCSVFISVPIKVLFDFANSIKWPQKQPNSDI